MLSGEQTRHWTYVRNVKWITTGTFMVIGSNQGNGPLSPSSLYSMISRMPVVREEIDEDSSNVHVRKHVARNVVRYVKANSTEKKALGRRKGKARENARKLEGIYHIDPKGKEFLETLKNVRKKLELRMDSAMPCNVRKIIEISSLKALTNPHEQTRDEHQQEEILSAHHHQNRCKTEYACTSMRGLRIDQNAHSQRLKTKMISIILPRRVQLYESLQSCALTCSYAPGNEDPRCEGRGWQIMGIAHWQVSKVKSKRKVIEKAQEECKTVHFATLVDLCHLKKRQVGQEDPKIQRTSGNTWRRCTTWLGLVCSVHWTARVIEIIRIRVPSYLDLSTTTPPPKLMGQNSRSRGTTQKKFPPTLFTKIAMSTTIRKGLDRKWFGKRFQTGNVYSCIAKRFCFCPWI